jgi:hypothetical protein
LADQRFRVKNGLEVGIGGSVIITKDDGNVGIGTSNPTQTLHVQGNVRITGGLYDSSNNVGAASSVLSSTGSGLRWVSPNSGAQGAQGIQGGLSAQGASGAQGAQGIQGGLSAQGASGAQGAQGIQGIAGPVAGSANQVVYKNASNTATGNANFLFLNDSTFIVGAATSTGTASQPLQVTGGAYVSGSVGIGTTNPLYPLTVAASGATATPNLTNVIADFTANTNSFSQINTRNASNGTSASSDYVVTADTGTDTTNFIDLGINNSAYSVGTWTINGALDGYLYTSDTNLSIGAAGANKYVSIFAGGTLAANEEVRVNSTGVGIGTTNPSQTLHVQGNARVTGAVYDSTNSPGTSGQVLQSTVTGTQWATASASGVGIRSDGTTIVGSGVTILDFTGPGIATVTSSGGIATITVASEDVFIVPLSDETSNIGIGTSVIAFRAPFPMRIVSIPRANVSTAATQGRVVVDVKVAGTTILGANKIGIDTNATTSTTAAVQTTLATNPTTIADDALMTFDITGIGTGAKGLKVNLYYYKNSN